MSFLESALSKMEDSGEKVETTVTEEVPVVEETTPVETPIVAEEVTPVAEETTTEEIPLPTKKEIDYKDWLEQNEGTIKTYLDEKSTDYAKLPSEELVRRKIKAENPDFDENDIRDELQDKYGIGLQKREIDDEMDIEEQAEIRKENAEIDKLISKGKRELKKDAGVATKFFEERKGNIELPKFEVDAPQPTETFDPVKYEEEINRQSQEYKEKEWIPQLKSIIEPLESLKEQIDFEDNGNKVVLDVDYKLSKDEKEQILGQLADYKAHPSDSKYINDKGVADVERFLQDKATELMYKKLLKTACKESYALGRKEFVKKDLVNFDDGVRDRSHATNDETDDAVGIWNTNKSRNS